MITLAQQSEALRIVTDPTRDHGRLLDLCDGDMQAMVVVVVLTAIQSRMPLRPGRVFGGGA